MSKNKTNPDFASSLGVGIRRVVCAAIRSPHTGRIICGARHYDAAMRQWFVTDGERNQEFTPADQGFIDQFCVFMDRQEAWKIAEAAGQIKGQSPNPGTLYSEDLY